MRTKLPLTIAALLSGLAAPLVVAQHETANSSMADCPMTKKKDAVQERADKGMGFSQARTRHHFRLRADGGTIEVSANDPKDETTRNQIRGHLSHVAQMFESGNFDIPMFVHEKMPDGAAVMQRKKEEIRYSYEVTKSGALVRIRTRNPEALKAVHDFLRFQIAEHQTGDPVTKS